MKKYILNRSTYIDGEYHAMGSDIKLSKQEAEKFLKKGLLSESEETETSDSEESETLDSGDIESNVMTTEKLGAFDNKEPKKTDTKEPKKK